MSSNTANGGQEDNTGVVYVFVWLAVYDYMYKTGICCPSGLWGEDGFLLSGTETEYPHNTAPESKAHHSHCDRPQRESHAPAFSK